MRLTLPTSLVALLLVTAITLAGRPAGAATPGNPLATARLNELMQVVTAGSDDALLQLLSKAKSEPGLLPLERDELLLAFIDKLRGMPPGAVGKSVLDFLSDYRPQALKPDEERPVVLVPVYNFRAATAGLENAWRRRESAYAGSVLLAQDPAALVQAYWLHDDPVVRRGLLGALDGASQGQLELVSFLALSGMEHEPDLADLAGEAALRVGDTRALEQLVRTGSGSAITRVLRAARDQLSADQVERLLGTAVEQAHPEIAAVAIAELAPALRGRPEFENRMFGLLDDRDLGSSAALALAADPSDATILRLGELVAKPETSSLASRRARLALDLVAKGVAEPERP